MYVYYQVRCSRLETVWMYYLILWYIIASVWEDVVRSNDPFIAYRYPYKYLGTGYVLPGSPLADRTSEHTARDKLWTSSFLLCSTSPSLPRHWCQSRREWEAVALLDLEELCSKFVETWLVLSLSLELELQALASDSELMWTRSSGCRDWNSETSPISDWPCRTRAPRAPPWTACCRSSGTGHWSRSAGLRISDWTPSWHSRLALGKYMQIGEWELEVGSYRECWPGFALWWLSWSACSSQIHQSDIKLISLSARARVVIIIIFVSLVHQTTSHYKTKERNFPWRVGPILGALFHWITLQSE